MASSFFFKGRYADYAKTLVTRKIDQDHGTIFPSYVSLYMVSALYGLEFGRFKQFDPDKDASNIAPAEIREEYFIRKPEYTTFRQMVIILERERNLSATQRIDNALRFDIPVTDSTPSDLAKVSKYDENTAIIDGYALGGLEYLYDSFGKLKDMEDIILEMERMRKEFGEVL